MIHIKTLVRYILRAVISLAVALVLSVLSVGINLPINIVTLSSGVFLGVPGIVLSIVLCNFVLI